mgnify:CR=1 FL=1
MRQRRRAERQNTARPTLKDNVHNRTEERYLQRILIGAAVALSLLIIGLLATGWYFNLQRPRLNYFRPDNPGIPAGWYQRPR